MFLSPKYNKLKQDILGKNYELSIAFIPPKKSCELNHKWRGKDKPTNVLAFPLSKTSGEILLCKSVIAREAKNFDRTPESFQNFLVIHGMLHLKGFDHGGIMERLERQYDKKYFDGNRRRLGSSASRRGRVFKGRKIS